MPVSVLSSMATRALLMEVAGHWDGEAEVTSVGGVEAAKRVRAGAAVDVVVLADAAMRKLAADGLLRPGLRPMALSSMAAAVREGADAPDLSSSESFRRALGAAGRVGYSTGPSGDHLLRLLADWGMRDTFQLVQAPPGVPVGRLLAEGTVDLAVQQLSELIGIGGVTVAGVLPPGAGSDTVFTAGVATSAAQPEQAARLVEFLATGHTEIKRRHGMRPIGEE